MSRRLIITADDYGMCEAINEAIGECLAAGAMRATCVMTNMPAYSAVGDLCKRFPESSIGLHWTLTQGRPVLPPSRVSTLVSLDGNFHSYSRFRCHWLMGRIDSAQVKAELGAQYQRFCMVAGEPDFWNTHQNVHMLPGLFRICVAFGQKLRISAMRCHRRLTVPHDTTSARYNIRHPLYWLKGRLIARWSHQAESQGVLMPDGRIHMPGYDAGVGAFEEVVKHLQWRAIRRAVELVAHPATELREELFGSLTTSRLREYKVLRDSELVDRLHGNGIETVGFEALHNGH